MRDLRSLPVLQHLIKFIRIEKRGRASLKKSCLLLTKVYIYKTEGWSSMSTVSLRWSEYTLQLDGILPKISLMASA